MALLSKNKIEFIDGTIERPNVDNAMFGIWRRCNNIVLSWLIKSMSPSIVQTAMVFTSAISLWDSLKERFTQSNVYRLVDLQGEIFSISQGTRSVTGYFACLQSL